MVAILPQPKVKIFNPWIFEDVEVPRKMQYGESVFWWSNNRGRSQNPASLRTALQWKSIWQRAMTSRFRMPFMGAKLFIWDASALGWVKTPRASCHACLCRESKKEVEYSEENHWIQLGTRGISTSVSRGIHLYDVQSFMMSYEHKESHVEIVVMDRDGVIYASSFCVELDFVNF